MESSSPGPVPPHDARAAAPAEDPRMSDAHKKTHAGIIVVETVVSGKEENRSIPARDGAVT